MTWLRRRRICAARVRYTREALALAEQAMKEQK